MRPGDAIATVEQLKSRFNASQATVTRALERLVREGIIYRPSGKNRLVIAEIRPRALHRIAIIRPTWPSPDYDAMVRGLLEVGQQRGWAFETVGFSQMEELELYRAVGANDGAILLFSRSQMPEHLANALRKPRKPVVLMRELPGDVDISGVSLDDVEVGRLAVQHLAERGHRNILAVVSEPLMRSVHERVLGWRQGLRSVGVQDPDTLLLDCGVPLGQDSIRHTYEVFRRWLRGPRPRFSAVFCVHWTGALAVGRALREDAGLNVPADVSMVAYGGESLLLPYLNPPLTAVEFDMNAYARAAIELLQRHFDNPQAGTQQVRVNPFLVERGSTRALETLRSTTPNVPE